MANKVNLI